MQIKRVVILIAFFSLFLNCFSCKQKDDYEKVNCETFATKLEYEDALLLRAPISRQVGGGMVNFNSRTLHYMYNDLIYDIDTITVEYIFATCLTPKWYIKETKEAIWLENGADSGDYPNKMDLDFDKKKKGSYTFIGQFYQHKGVVPDVGEIWYLREKCVDEARIFKITKLYKTQKFNSFF